MSKTRRIVEIVDGAYDVELIRGVRKGRDGDWHVLTISFIGDNDTSTRRYSRDIKHVRDEDYERIVEAMKSKESADDRVVDAIVDEIWSETYGCSRERLKQIVERKLNGEPS